MKWKLFFVGFLTAVALCLLAVSITSAAQPAPELVMQSMFDKHPDFPCATAFKANVNAKYTGAREPFLDLFAKARGLDPDRVQCFWFAWLFDRDVNASHYAKRGGINNFDRAALHYRDLNEVAYELGGQPLFRYINDETDRPRNQWVIGNGMIAE